MVALKAINFPVGWVDLPGWEWKWVQNLSPGTWKTLREDGDTWSCEFV